MPDCPQIRQLRELLDEKLPEDDRVWVSGHVADCSVCQSQLDALTSEDILTEPNSDKATVVTTETDDEIQKLMQRLKKDETETVATLSRGASTTATQTIVFPEPATATAPLGGIDKYEVQEQLGKGASGYLFKARDRQLHRTVALKVLRQELMISEKAHTRFESEARAAASLVHPNIIAIHDVQSPENFPSYLALEFVEGESLRDRLERKGRTKIKEAVQIVRQVMRGLQAAHDEGVVHRDIKPANVMIDLQKGKVKIADFGLARLMDQPTGLTQEGIIAGTPQFMSPEQINSPTKVDGRSDIYSAGVLFYELLTGEVPFDGDLRTVLHSVCNVEPEAPRSVNGEVPRDLETVCLKMMAKDVDRRYQTAGEVVNELGRWLVGKPIQARSVTVWEKAWYWARQHPRVAALSGAFVVVLFALIYLGTGLFANSSDSNGLGETLAQNESGSSDDRRDGRRRSVPQRNRGNNAFPGRGNLQSAPPFPPGPLTNPFGENPGIESQGPELGGPLAPPEMRPVPHLPGSPVAAVPGFPAGEWKKMMDATFRGNMAIRRRDYDRASREYEEAANFARDVYENRPDDVITREQLAMKLATAAWAQEQSGEMDNAYDNFSEAADLGETLLEDIPDYPFGREVARWHRSAAMLSIDDEDGLQEARHRLTRSVDILSSLTGQSNVRPDLREEFVLSLLELSDLELVAGDEETSAQLFEDAWQQIRELKRNGYRIQHRELRDRIDDDERFSREGNWPEEPPPTSDRGTRGRPVGRGSHVFPTLPGGNIPSDEDLLHPLRN